MDVIYLRSNIDSLINHMRVKKYSACYIKQVRSMTNHIIRQEEFDALVTIEGEKQRKVKPKWNKETDTLTSICGLRKMKT